VKEVCKALYHQGCQISSKFRGSWLIGSVWMELLIRNLKVAQKLGLGDIDEGSTESLLESQS
jgi:hypothetical protein